MMSINQLKCFIAVATELNFRRAATSLNMSQPPLTRQIQLLEYQLNVKLIDRSTRSVSLTAAGKSFYREASKLLEHIHQVEQFTKKMANGEHGSVSLGFVANAYYQLVPQILSRLKENFPFIKISQQQLPTFELIESVYMQKLDLGISRIIPNHNNIESLCCLSEPFIAALPGQHPLARQQSVRLQDLDNQAMIMYSIAWKPFYDLLTRTIGNAGVKPNYVMYEANTINIQSLVNAGLGIALIPQSASVFKLDNVTYLPLESQPELTNDLYYIWRKDNNNEAFKLILQTLIDDL